MLGKDLYTVPTFKKIRSATSVRQEEGLAALHPTLLLALTLHCTIDCLEVKIDAGARCRMSMSCSSFWVVWIIQPNLDNMRFECSGVVSV